MKIKLKFLVLIIFCLALFSSVALFTPAYAASLFLSPGSGNFGQGAPFSVSVDLNTGGEAVNAVEVTLTFPADKLRANYISNSGSSFDIAAESTVGNGIVRISKGKLPPSVSGSAHVASVGFTAIGQGSATVSIGGDSKILKEADSSNIFGGGGGATFTIGAPVAGAPPQTGGATQVSAPSVSPQPDTIPPKISNVKALKLGPQTTTITWTTDKDADSQVEYGFVFNRQQKEFNYFFTAALSDLVQNHKVALEQKTLIGGYLYHFRVLSKDAAGNLAKSQDQTFILPGYRLKISVLDLENKKAPNVLVRLAGLGIAGTTNENGQVVFSDLPVGQTSVLAQYNGKIQEAWAKIVADNNNKLTIVLSQKLTKGVNFLLVFVLVLVIAGIGFLGLKYWKRRFQN